ncbi:MULTISPECIES: hypothetical protein [unclassified Streptomyces]|uniref:hypothetical protein n=1 Tax=unclassified Streptomyces TaxID=2593676 RepID=UPI000CD59FC7|nr:MULTISPECIES: hypothetical protein [unclassified Streptomyces]
MTSGIPPLRATTVRLTAEHVRIHDLVSFGGRNMAVTFSEHRGGLVRIELDRTVRAAMPPATALVVTRPRHRR